MPSKPQREQSKVREKPAQVVPMTAAASRTSSAWSPSCADEFADELRERGEDVEDEPTAGGGGVQVLVQRRETDTALSENLVF
ncbi:hypothetical protein [Streptomyces tendae]|uniref:hypothetical protein n=1 Tax=Streptomyces tendae TaxID=1932 RepID=UPI004032C0C6